MRRLYYILNYELSTSTLLLLAGLGPLFIVIAMLTSLLFTPYMLYVLYKDEKYGWIITFSLFVIIPTLLNFIQVDSMMFKSSLNYVVLGMFYFYCFLLRFSVKDWLEEEFAKRQREYEMQDTDKSKLPFEEFQWKFQFLVCILFH